MIGLVWFMCLAFTVVISLGLAVLARGARTARPNEKTQVTAKHLTNESKVKIYEPG